MEKKDIRKRIWQKIREISEEEKSCASKKVCEIILSREEYQKAQVVLSYMAMKNELDPMEITKSALKDKKSVYLPRTEPEGNKMDFYLIDSSKNFESQLETGRWEILEPNKNCCALNSMEMCGKKILAIIPGVGFSESGTRMGHGMGFYDIYISNLKNLVEKEGGTVYLLGVCFGCQIDEDVAEVSQNHDIVMDKVIFA